jgi:hypothetical protein
LEDLWQTISHALSPRERAFAEFRLRNTSKDCLSGSVVEIKAD